MQVRTNAESSEPKPRWADPSDIDVRMQLDALEVEWTKHSPTIHTAARLY